MVRRRLIKAAVGVEAVAIDVQGWDTHSNQGPISGTMATLMTTLAGGLAALTKRVKDAFDPRGVLGPGRMWAGV